MPASNPSRADEYNIALNSHYRDVAKEAGFKVVTKIVYPEPKPYWTPALRCKGASHRRYYLDRTFYIANFQERSNYVLKEYADPKSILRAYLISPKKNALRSTTRTYPEGGIGLTYGFYAEEDRLPATGPTSRYIVTGYFEENDGGIYKPPFRPRITAQPSTKGENPNNNEDDKKEPP
ncbi:hypothetical protein QBC39DRAFT_334981 [Podospora conica]|nr:hypothetical protein QBC39DRAFT_334981 [Schizothecium conicum]